MKKEINGNGNGNGNSILSKFAQSISVLGIVGFLGFTFMSISNIQRDVAVANNRLTNIEEKTKDIVPRAEHERQWLANEKHFDETESRLARLEQFILTNIKGVVGLGKEQDGKRAQLP